MVSRLSNWLKLLDETSYLKAYCPVVCEPRSCSFSRIRVFSHSHFAFISTRCGRKLLSSFPPLFSNHGSYIKNILMLYSLDARESPGICRTCNFPGALASIKDQGRGGGRGHLLSLPCLLGTSVQSHWYGEDVL